MNAIRRLLRGENDIDFPKWWKRGLIFSAVLVVVSVVSLATRGLNLGIDFEGGISWEVSAPGVSVSDARSALAAVGEDGAKIQIVGLDILRVQGPAASQDHQDEVRQKLADLSGASVAEVSVSTVGPSWGNEITKSAIRALAIFLLAILLYLAWRLEWKMAVGAIVAVVHDVIISVGVYSVFQFEVTPATVIAFLTILGYSIYDTVVVFDKVKENEGRVGLSSRLTYTDMMSLSMNQVLLRSLNTSIVSLIPVISLLIVGAGILGAVTLEEFAIALTVGLTAGAYSSIFIAAPTVVWLKEREPKNRQIRDRIETAKPASSRRTASATTAADAEDDATVGAPASAPTGSGAVTPTGAIPPRPRKKTKKR